MKWRVKVTETTTFTIEMTEEEARYIHTVIGQRSGGQDREDGLDPDVGICIYYALDDVLAE